MKAVTELRGTAWTVQLDDDVYTDSEGHTWFSLGEARKIAQRTGGLPVRSTTRSTKRVVTGYADERI